MVSHSRVRDSLNPLPWIDSLTQYFYQAIGVPDIILGSSKVLTEASAKIAFAAFQKTIEEEQKFLIDSIEAQIGLEVSFEFPMVVQNEMLNEKSKVNQPEVQNTNNVQEPNDTQVEMEGRK